MSNFEIGDIVVLTAGSMRMAVEAVEGDEVKTVWAHEGSVGRDSFNAKLLRKWEAREDDRGGRSGGRDFGNKGGGDRRPSDKPRGKPGWDGKPREKKFFRKD
ncbi:hypothetical protein [Oceanomicrobium pacificus]|uniref:DUF2158 domain-containing protein n=1 Tax=Oceanomicrobium pacificus TaxID=2692916 RepID=A0A6B0TRR4_9RHOB|nr:hypothetical protein [Oceanomicrobium pacificus]MXU64428.1 hypothetical protein [Oceanomicrobium pacificus]